MSKPHNANPDAPSIATLRSSYPLCDAPHQSPALGCLGYGSAPSPVPSPFPLIQADVLSGAPRRLMQWHGGPSLESGRTGCVQWQLDDHWLFGAIDLEESAHPDGLIALAQQAYRDLFQTLQDTRRPHLLRLWNYVPRINENSAGLERYRQFNQGRQQAFLDAGQAAFDGAPAACALGTHRGPLSIRFLAGCTRPVPLENPRQVSAYRYPTAYGPRSPTFSRAAFVDAGDGLLALFISGTASIVGHETLHAGNVEAQAEETLRNLEAVIHVARQRSGAPFDLEALDCTVYVRHANDVERIRQVLMNRLGPQSPAVRDALFLSADICRSDLLVEIEAQALVGKEHLPSII